MTEWQHPSLAGSRGSCTVKTRGTTDRLHLSPSSVHDSSLSSHLKKNIEIETREPVRRHSDALFKRQGAAGRSSSCAS